MPHQWQLPAIDPSVAVRDYEQRLQSVASPRHRQMLETLIEHIRTVVVCDVEGVMATMVADPEFSTWGPTGDQGPKGGATVRDGYAGAFAREVGPITNQVNSVERLVIDDDSIALQLTERRICSATEATGLGYDVPTATGYYAVRRRCAVIIPFDDELLIRGEHNYGFGWPVDPQDFEAVQESDLTPESLAWLKKKEGNR